MKILGKIVLFAGSFVLSGLAAYYWWLHDWTLVGFLMASILLHETGHWVVLAKYGMKPSMFFVPLLGAAVVAPNWLNLKHKQIAIVALAGPAVNFILFVAGYIIYLEGVPYGLKLASLNASLAWFNLIPFFILDGQKFAKAIFSSLNEQGDKIVAGIISAVAILVGLGLIIAGKVNFFYLLIYFGITRESNKDDPNDAYGPKAMTTTEAKNLVIFYMVMLFITMIASAVLPFWLG